MVTGGSSSSSFLRVRLLLLFSIINVVANDFDRATKFGELDRGDGLFRILLKIIDVALHPSRHIMDCF